MHGGNDDDMQGSSKKGGVKEKQTLSPLTVKMFNDSVINQNDLLEFESIALHEVNFLFLSKKIKLVGHFISYKEEGVKVKITLWDQTGYVDIIFFNKNESESHVGLQNFDQNQ
jgi:hypothetical protein